MSEEQRLQHKIDECQQRWDTLSKLIKALNKQYDLEVRAEERLRLKEQISAQKVERTEVEGEWQAFEAQLKPLKKVRLIQDARKMEVNKAYPEAIQTWQEIRALESEDPTIGSEIERLQAKQRQFDRLDGYIKDLTRRFPKIKSIYNSVVQRLKQLKETAAEDDTVVELVRCFLEGQFSAEEFQQAWEAFQSKPLEASGAEEPDYRVLVERLRRGEIVLFLGPNIASDCNAECPFPKTVISGLASRANYDGFEGSLSKIAEYYQITELGRSSLIRDLGNLIEAVSPVVPFYELLIRIEQPLILISAGYDTLLENAFRRGGKKFVLISSIITSTPEYDLGNLFIQYSDRVSPEPPCLEEDLSGLEPLDKGYTLIYKIRGYCDTRKEKLGYQKDTLTVSEENYFTFARHLDKLIPNYITRKLSGRGLLFLGFSPRDWEDRLIVNAILNKRHRQDEPPYTISREADQFERAYWEFQNVRRRAVDLREFVRNLEAQFL